MSTRIIYNSETISEASLYNSSFLYGESVFTSSRVQGSQFAFKEHHLERLEKGACYLFDFKENKLFETINIRLSELLELNKEAKNNYLRITIYKSLKGDLEFSILIDNKIVHTNELRLATQKTDFNSGLPEFVKLGNYAYRNNIRNKILKNNFDDVLFVDSKDYLCELSTSNIFFYDKTNKIILTPCLGPNVLDGIMRKNLLLFLKEINQPYVEKNITKSETASFSEAFSTNCFSGLRNITSIDNINFEVNFTSKLLNRFKLEKLV